MLDVKDLERRWIKYKIKRYLPYIGGVAFIATLATGIIVWNEEKKSPQAATAYTPPAQPAVNKPAPPREMGTNATVLEPSMNFVQTFQAQNIAQETPAVPAVPAVKPAITAAGVPAQKVLQMPDSAPPVPQQTHNIPSAASKALQINRNESKLEIEELQYRFKETSNPNLGLFIAKYYYDRGNYTEAHNYALKTNAINSRIDESWVLFSKSLMKLGRAEQAKKTLQLYYQQSGSEEARALLESIEKGTFK